MVMIHQILRFVSQVFLIGHVPPGAFERAPGKKWFYPQFNKKYIHTILKHSDVITGHFLAHQHCDSFKIFYDENGEKLRFPISLIYGGVSGLVSETFLSYKTFLILQRKIKV